MKVAAKNYSIAALIYLCICAEAFTPTCTLSSLQECKIHHRSQFNSYKRSGIKASGQNYIVAPLYATTEQTCEDVAITTTLDEPEDPRIVVVCKETNEAEQDSNDGTNDDNEYDNDDENESEEIEEEELQKRKRAAMAARLLKKGSTLSRSRSGSVSESKVKNAAARDTSVGTRREGSASRARSRTAGARGGGLSGRILKGIRGTAAAAAAAKRKAESDRDSGSGSTSASKEGPSVSAAKKNVIQSTIDVLIEAQNEMRSLEKSTMGLLEARNGISESYWSIGMQHLELPTKPLPGTILVDHTACTETKSKDTFFSKELIRDNTIVRVATVKDDSDIAKLRLSVFSDFSPEIRRQFRSRSCEVLGHRRMKGATCLVADYGDADMEFGPDEDTAAHSWIIGSVECSTHEFAGTQLGMRRPSGSILYITEVAVSPRARRTGAGTKLLKVRIQCRH